MEARHVLLTALLVAGLSGCASAPTNTADPDYELSRKCGTGLDTAYQELSFSEAKGFGGTWEYTKAASLLSAAKVQSGFGGYEGCIEKVESARAYIRESQQQ